MFLETRGRGELFCSGWAEWGQGRGQWSENQKTEKHGPCSIECPRHCQKWEELGQTSGKGGYETRWDNLGTGLRFKKIKIRTYAKATPNLNS